MEYFRQSPPQYKNCFSFIILHYKKTNFVLLMFFLLLAAVIKIVIPHFYHIFFCLLLITYLLVVCRSIIDFFTFYAVDETGIYLKRKFFVEKQSFINFAQVVSFVDYSNEISLYYKINGKKKKFKFYSSSLNHFMLVLSFLMSKKSEVKCKQVTFLTDYLNDSITLSDYLKKNMSSWEQT